MYKKKRLLIFGFGYTSKFMCHTLAEKNWEVFCTTRFRNKSKEIKSINATPIIFNDEEKINSILAEDLFVLSTVPPESGKDPVMENYGHLLAKNNERIKNLVDLISINLYTPLS